MFDWHPPEPPRRRDRSAIDRAIDWFLARVIVVLAALLFVLVATTVFVAYVSLQQDRLSGRQTEPSALSVAVQQKTEQPVAQQPAQQAPVSRAIAPCEPPESLRCKELRGEVPPEPEIQGIKLDFGSTGTERSFMETFGWWILTSLVVAVLAAGVSRWTVRQTIPVAVGIVALLIVIQNWWLFFLVVVLLFLTIIGMAVRNLLVGGVRGVRGVAGALPQGASLFVIWEIIQTLWTPRFIGAQGDEDPLQRARQRAQPVAPN